MNVILLVHIHSLQSFCTDIYQKYHINYNYYFLKIIEDWKEELIKHRDWFLAQNSIICDESRRAKKSDEMGNMLAGVEGSFRKLEVD